MIIIDVNHLCTGIQAEEIEEVLVFPPSISSVCINFIITDDRIALETSEEFILEVLPPDNPLLRVQVNSTRIIIVDDDGKCSYVCYIMTSTFITVIVVGFNPMEYNISEGDGVVTLTVERRGATVQPAMVNVTLGDLIVTGT